MFDQWWIDPLPEDFDLDACIKNLASKDAKIRAQASWDLSTAADNSVDIEKAVPALLRALSDENKVAFGASYAFRYHFANRAVMEEELDPSCIVPLVIALASKQDVVRENCAWALDRLIHTNPLVISEKVENELQKQKIKKTKETTFLFELCANIREGLIVGIKWDSDSGFGFSYYRVPTTRLEDALGYAALLALNPDPHGHTELGCILTKTESYTPPTVMRSAGKRKALVFSDEQIALYQKFLKEYGTLNEVERNIKLGCKKEKWYLGPTVD